MTVLEPFALVPGYLSASALWMYPHQSTTIIVKCTWAAVTVKSVIEAGLVVSSGGGDVTLGSIRGEFDCPPYLRTQRTHSFCSIIETCSFGQLMYIK
eukprot:scaffold105726_cov19-Prasinocladus_malaysianus.AAC.1